MLIKPVVWDAAYNERLSMLEQRSTTAKQLVFKENKKNYHI